MIGRDKGIDVIDKEKGRANHYVNQPDNPNSLIANDVNSIIQDSKGLFWIGTKDGLSILNKQTNKFYNFNEANGLPGNNVLNILEDVDGNFGRVQKTG